MALDKIRTLIWRLAKKIESTISQLLQIARAIALMVVELVKIAGLLVVLLVVIVGDRMRREKTENYKLVA